MAVSTMHPPIPGPLIENGIAGPQIVLSVYKGMQLEGYGRVHMPLRPGVHKLDVSLAKPVGSSLLGYVGSFFGYQSELLQPKMLATTAGNHRKIDFFA